MPVITRPHIVLALCLAAAPALATAKPRASALTAAAVNGATFAPLPETPDRHPTAELIRAAVLLDRARMSPGAIDGIDGDNLHKAVSAYQQLKGLPVSGRLDQATWDRLVADDPAPVLAERRLTAADEAGPFVHRIPAKFEAQAKLKRLAYASPLEALSEEGHATPGLLRALNPGVTFKRKGASVLLPQVVVQRPPASVARIVVDKPGHAVDALAADGTRLAVYPASIGSAEKPAPSGDFTIRRVIHNPDYTYNPKYAFKGVKATKPFTIAPGPNNPVGSVWMDLSFEGYGIHGTPQPDLVGKTQSHGCIRLTNWDAEDLASMVKPGTPVTFSDGPVPAAPAAPAAAPAASSPVPPPAAPLASPPPATPPQ